MKLLLAPIAFIFTMLMIYLAGAFGHATFDISLWDASNRGRIGFYGLVFSTIAGGFTYAALKGAL